MTTYRTSDGLTLVTEKSRATWKEREGPNILHCTRKGRYYLECRHYGDEHVEWLDNLAAARWLTANNYSLPEDLETANSYELRGER